MLDTRLKMGRVGDRMPPPGLVKDLASFDNGLRLFWDSRQQVWTVTQKVRRNEPVGFAGGVHYSQVVDAERVVLRLIGHTGEPDRRIFPELWKQRALDRAERLERAKANALEVRKAKEDAAYERGAPSRERMSDDWYKLRRETGGAYIAPRNGWLSSKESAA